MSDEKPEAEVAFLGGALPALNAAAREALKDMPAMVQGMNDHLIQTINGMTGAILNGHADDVVEARPADPVGEPANDHAGHAGEELTAHADHADHHSDGDAVG